MIFPLKTADKLIGLSEVYLYQQSQDCSYITTTYTKVKIVLAGRIKTWLTVVTKACYAAFCSCCMQDICIQPWPIKKQAFIFIMSCLIPKKIILLDLCNIQKLQQSQHNFWKEVNQDNIQSLGKSLNNSCPHGYWIGVTLMRALWTKHYTNAPWEWIV